MPPIQIQRYFEDQPTNGGAIGCEKIDHTFHTRSSRIAIRESGYAVESSSPAKEEGFDCDRMAHLTWTHWRWLLPGLLPWEWKHLWRRRERLRSL